MKVTKFGGSSLADATQFKKVANIIKSDSTRKFIVVSAPGKRHDHDFKLTDLLIELGQAVIKGEKHKSYHITILDRFSKIIEDLELDNALFKEIEQKIARTMNEDLNEELTMNSF